MTEVTSKLQENDAEIDLAALFMVIWKGKWIVICATFLLAIASVFYAIYTPDIYQSEALLSPVEQDQSFGGLQGQLGGLASIAGINLGSGSSNKGQLAIEILKSRSFISGFVQKHNILPDLFAVESWDSSSNTIRYKTQVYNELSDTWVREVSPPLKPKPSMQEAHRRFVELLTITTKPDTGIVSVSIKHQSPSIAKQWVDWLVQDINQTMKKRDVEEAEKSAAFLNSQLMATKITNIRDVLFGLLEEQAKTIMFASVRDEYVFKVIDPAVIPEKKSGPKRALISVLGALVGGILGVMIVVFRHFIKL